MKEAYCVLVGLIAFGGGISGGYFASRDAAEFLALSNNPKQLHTTIIPLSGKVVTSDPATKTVTFAAPDKYVAGLQILFKATYDSTTRFVGAEPTRDNAQAAEYVRQIAASEYATVSLQQRPEGTFHIISLYTASFI